jgi:shikimate dehydrogenase
MNTASPDPAFELGAGGARLVPTIGEPIHQIKAPLLLNAHFRRAGINAVAFPWHVPAAQLAAAMSLVRSSENMAGLTVTVPHKVSVLPLLDELTPRARRAGAVNIVARDAVGRLRGDMVDGLGFIADLASRGVTLRGRRVLLVGAGGAGRALVSALCDCELASLWVSDLLPERARAAADITPGRAVPVTAERLAEVLAGADIAINASSAGLLDSDPLPIPLEHAPRHLLVADINVLPGGTALEREAQRRSLAFVDGSGMLRAQLDLFLAFFGLAR